MKLVDAVKRHDRATVATLITGGANLNAPLADGATALHWAAYEDDAEELMQQAYVQAYSALSGFAHTAKFSTWLIRIGLNAALASRRRDARFASPEADPQSSEEEPVAKLPSPLPDPEDQLRTRELSR